MAPRKPKAGTKKAPRAAPAARSAGAPHNPGLRLLKGGAAPAAVDDDFALLDEELDGGETGELLGQMLETLQGIVDEQLRTNEPPEVMQTFRRLQQTGLSLGDTLELIEMALYAACLEGLVRNLDVRDIDHGEYIRRLHALPDLPEVVPFSKV